MKVAYRWLREFVKTDYTAEEAAERFRLTSSEVEGIERWDERFEHMVVGKVLSVAPHPQADRLRIAQVSVKKGETRQIVCGAPNLEEGQTVAVALPGARVVSLKGESFVIAESTIRGSLSSGMLCAAEELSLPPEGDGIMALDDGLAAGTPLGEALCLDDTVLDLEITPNRPDLLSYRGLARELCAIEKKRLSEPPIYHLDATTAEKAAPLGVSVEDSRLCPRYSAICLEIPEIKPSPRWLQARLILSGIRPINEIVDITNYVMLETGQPLHAFDLESVLSQKPAGIRVRSAHAKEKISLLDGSQRELKTGDIVIADGRNQPIALAGIMGGDFSAIRPESRRIVVESACFLGSQIRRTSRALGVRSEASTRFEKGLDPEQTVSALKRAVYLLREIAGAEVNSQLLDWYPKGRPDRPRIHLSFARIQQIVGVHISPAETKGILQHLGFQIPSLTKSSFEAVPPSWRKDVTLPEDLIEELVRIWGLERLPSTLPQGTILPPQPNRYFFEKHAVRRRLAALGLHECIHLSFTSSRSLQRTGYADEAAVRLDYPLSQETEFLIPSHSVHLLENCGQQNLGESELGLFEIGRVFLPPGTEKECLSVLLRSNRPAEMLYRQAKTILSQLYMALSLPLDPGTPLTAPSESDFPPFYQAGTASDILCQGKKVGRLGVVSPETVSRFKIRSGRSLVYVEIDLELLLGLPRTHRPYQPPPVYPSIERDLTLICPESLPVGEIARHLPPVVSQLPVIGWEISDMYRGKPLALDEKSVTLHFVYNGSDRTLSDEEAEKAEAEILRQLRDCLPVRLSGN